MDKDRDFKVRFCWPQQDRARAISPFQAPRKSSVFTASVSLASSTPVLVPEVLSQAVPAISLLDAVTEVSCGCRWVGSPGHFSLIKRHVKASCHAPQVPRGVVDSHGSQGRIARGFFSHSGIQADSHAVWCDEQLCQPDWRVLGGQDPAPLP